MLVNMGTFLGNLDDLDRWVYYIFISLCIAYYLEFGTQFWIQTG